MKKLLKRIICLLFICTTIISMLPAAASGTNMESFSDVPKGYWAEEYINTLRELGITDGIGNNKFGPRLTITRCEFASYLVRLMKWEIVKPTEGSFTDNLDTSKWYYPYIETALKNGALVKSSAFRPEDPITREDMAIMLVRALGYDSLTVDLNGLTNTFSDVKQNQSYINIAKDFGIISGVTNTLFKPSATATREQAAAMMVRMYDGLNKPLSELHGFYAIGSYSQIDMIKNLDSVSFGWSHLEYDQEKGCVALNTTSSNNNDYSIPSGFTEPLDVARKNNVSAELMVYANNASISGTTEGAGTPFLQYVLTNAEISSKVIAAIIAQVNSTQENGSSVSFDGVTIDFEGMKGDVLKNSFNTFLSELNEELDKTSKKLLVAVPPKEKPGLAYFDGYDFRTIGNIADKVILMAHDYSTRSLTDEEMLKGNIGSSLTPEVDVYYALKAITDKNTGVQDKSKIMLQFSFDSVQWKKTFDGKLVNSTPYKPSYEAIWKRLLSSKTLYHNSLLNTLVVFGDSTDRTINFLFYEDSNSIEGKIKLAGMFGIKGISLWRLGNIPNYTVNSTQNIYMDVWQQILNKM